MQSVKLDTVPKLLDALLDSLENSFGKTFEYKQNGATYRLDCVTILNMKLVDILKLVNTNTLISIT